MLFLFKYQYIVYKNQYKFKQNVIFHNILMNNVEKKKQHIVQDAQKGIDTSPHFAEKRKSTKKRIEIIAFLVYN